MIEALEIKTSMLFNVDFASNTFLSSFFFFYLIIYLYSFVPAATVKIFNPIAELLIPIGTLIKEAKPGMETHPVFVEAK